MSLRVFTGEAMQPAEVAASDAADPMPIKLYAQPIPLVVNNTEHMGPDGPYVDTTRVWYNEDGRCCRYCPGRCSFQEGRRGIGFCLTRRPGTLPDVTPTPVPPSVSRAPG